jgi:hypothetical protein
MRSFDSAPARLQGGPNDPQSLGAPQRAVFGTICFSSLARADVQRPKIIFIMADDLGNADLDYRGGKIETPNIDKLASDGVRHCVVDDAGGRPWRRQCPTNPEQINILVRRHAGDDARIGIETGAMTPWLVHELRNLGLAVVCFDARHARATLEMQINKTDQNDAEGLD